MPEESTPKDLSSQTLLPEKEPAGTTPSPATEAIKKAPDAVRRSMPMGLSIAVGILLASLLAWLTHYLVSFLFIIYLSFIAATIMEAPVQWIKRRGIRRGMAAVIVMGGALLLLFILFYVLGNGIYSQVAAVQSDLGKAPERINTYVNGFKHRYPALGDKMGDFDVAKAIVSTLPQDFSTVWANALTGVEMISWLVIMFFVVMYMLIDGASHLKNARNLLPKHARLEATRLFNEIAKAHRGWALASFSNVISASLLTGIGLYFIGIPGAFVLGFVAGLGELIPNIGPLLGAMPAVLFSALILPDKFLYVVGMFVVVQTIQSYTISPQMLKFSIELPVLVTIISVIVFGILFGFLGILVAIPLVADMVVLWQYLNRYLEKDTTDYDVVNSAAYGRRTAMSPDNTSPSRLRKIFRRSAARPPNTPETPQTAPRSPVPASPDPSDGLGKLADAERRATP